MEITDPVKELQRLRRYISLLDTLLLCLLACAKKDGCADCAQSLIAQVQQMRLQVALAIELEKRALGQPIYCPKREREELGRLQRLAEELKLPLQAEEIEAFFQEVFAASREAQERQRREATGSPPPLT